MIPGLVNYSSAQFGGKLAEVNNKGYSAAPKSFG
jgi:hypothetical protein